eukprot:284056_1
MTLFWFSALYFASDIAVRVSAQSAQDCIEGDALWKSLVLEGAAVKQTGNVVRLTPNAKTSKGLATLGPLTMGGFPVKFSYEYKIGPPGTRGADGIWAFITADPPDAIGKAGGGGLVDDSSILGVEIDHYYNRDVGDSKEDHVAIFDKSKKHDYSGPCKLKNGVQDNKWHTLSFEATMATATTMKVVVKNDGGVVCDRTVKPHADAIVELGKSGKLGYFNIFAATGGATAEHSVRSVSVCNVVIGKPPTSGPVNGCYEGSAALDLMALSGAAKLQNTNEVWLTQDRNKQKGLATIGPINYAGLPLEFDFDFKIGPRGGQAGADGIWAFLTSEPPNALGSAGGGGVVDDTSFIGVEIDHYKNGG